MSLEGLKEFQQNLKRVGSWTDSAIKEALERAAGNTISHIKTKQIHLWGKSLTKVTVKEHPHKEFYMWTEELINSIRRGNVEAYLNGAQIEIRAGDKTINYAALVELGGPNRRAFPFLKPALEKTQGENLVIMAGVLKKVFE